MKPKTFQVLTMAVEEGVSYGVHRAYKHSDNPDHDYMTNCIADAVLNSICEWFDLDEDAVHQSLPS